MYCYFLLSLAFFADSLQNTAEEIIEAKNETQGEFLKIINQIYPLSFYYGISLILPSCM